jgi:hypothetical protein
MYDWARRLIRKHIDINIYVTDHSLEPVSLFSRDTDRLRMALTWFFPPRARPAPLQIASFGAMTIPSSIMSCKFLKKGNQGIKLLSIWQNMPGVEVSLGSKDRTSATRSDRRRRIVAVITWQSGKYTIGQED